MSAVRPEQQFADLGYAHLPGWLSGDALAATRDLVDAVMTDAPEDESCRRPNNTLVPLRWNDPAVAQTLGDIQALQRLSRLSVKAGDAVVTDYRLLHGTHANATGVRRDCVLLSFTPNWSELPEEIRGHLISHPALPGADETAPRGVIAELLPSYDGPRADLPLNRNAPPDFRLTVN